MMAQDQIWSETIDETINEHLFNDDVIEQPLSMTILDIPDLQKY